MRRTDHPLRRLAGPAAALLFLAACGPARSGAGRVLLIGDSITEGWVGPHAEDPLGQSFAVLLRGLLPPGLEAINLGCAGASASDWRPAGPRVSCGSRSLRPYEDSVRTHLPAQLAVVLLGTNDAFGPRGGSPVAPEAYRHALDALVAGLLHDGVGTVLLMSPPRAPTGAPAEVPPRLRAYRRQVREACATTASVVCGPDVHELLDPAAELPPGDVHPNAAGHAHIARELAAAIAQRFQATAPRDGSAGGPIRWALRWGVALGLSAPVLWAIGAFRAAR